MSNLFSILKPWKLFTDLNVFIHNNSVKSLINEINTLFSFLVHLLLYFLDSFLFCVFRNFLFLTFSLNFFNCFMLSLKGNFIKLFHNFFFPTFYNFRSIEKYLSLKESLSFRSHLHHLLASHLVDQDQCRTRGFSG